MEDNYQRRREERIENAKKNLGEIRRITLEIDRKNEQRLKQSERKNNRTKTIKTILIAIGTLIGVIASMLAIFDSATAKNFWNSLIGN